MHVEYRNQKEEKKIKNIRFHRFRVLDIFYPNFKYRERDRK
jgi:hypothetical protein